MSRGRKIERKCKSCGDVFYPRAADVARGWGKFCSKSCKASKQEKETGQYSKLKSRVRATNDMYQLDY